MQPRHSWGGSSCRGRPAEWDERGIEALEVAHDEYHEALTDDEDIADSEKWFDAVEKDYIASVKKGKTFLKSVSFGVGANAPAPTVKVEASLSDESAGKSDDNEGNHDDDDYDDDDDEDKDGMTMFMNMLHLPRLELDVYEGDPAGYHMFISVFDEVIDSKVSDPQVWNWPGCCSIQVDRPRLHSGTVPW